MTRRRRHPRYYVGGMMGEYTICERATPYDEYGVRIIETDQYRRAAIINRALNDQDGWDKL